MADAAQALGWTWLGIAITSNAEGRQWCSCRPIVGTRAKIRKYNQNWQDEGVNFRLFHGVESDILAGGKLDHPDEVLNELDYVVASVHAMTKWRGRMRARTRRNS